MNVTSDELEIGGCRLVNGDCISGMDSIADGSVDAIITDLPYGVFDNGSEASAWDSELPMEEMWRQFWRVSKPSAPVILFSQGLFTARLITSETRNFRYTLVWDKCRTSGFLNSGRMPLRRHEDICVFYRKLPTYNPQLEDLNGRERTHSRGTAPRKGNRCYARYGDVPTRDDPRKFPSSILRFQRPHCTGNHPTEKPVELLRYLVRSYTNAGDLVLDATMGSGSTAVACEDEGRRFIGFEKEKRYFDVAVGRVKKCLNIDLPLFEIMGGE